MLTYPPMCAYFDVQNYCKFIIDEGGYGLRNLLHACWSFLLHLSFFFQGMRDGQQIRFSDEGDQEPGLEPGDIIIVLDENEHTTFKRKGESMPTC